ncbi:MAG: mismatch repair protein MutS [Acidobacteriota bacterium]|nr:mismatch repair protein MutS [Acidobacteriota bacterium]
MLRQYHELKRQHPGTLLFFRLGDFYELFFDDAVTGARELEITLTARHKERGDPIPMCGVPHHAASTHIARLVRKGYRVAICEQTEDPSQAKKLVRREVVRVITPGTAIDPQLVEARETIYLAAVCGTGERMAAAFLDLSTGEFRATEASGRDAWSRIRADVESFAPREILYPASLAPLIKSSRDGALHTAPLPLKQEENTQSTSSLRDVNEATDSSQRESVFTGATLTPIDDWLWQADGCAAQLCEQFGALSLEGFGLEGKSEAVRAAGACLRYAQEMQRATAAHISDITYFEAQDHLILDQVTVRNLQLVEAQAGTNRASTLLNVIDETVTGMGARLLRSWLLRPSVRRGEIEARLGAVGELNASQIKRDRLRALLKEVADLDRLCGRLNMNSASPRDLNALLRSLNQVPQVRRTLDGSQSSLLQVLLESMDELQEIRSLIEQGIADDPPAKLSDGGAIRDGYESELDELRGISRNAKQTIAALEARERVRSGISTLRIRYNNVFGYFLEVSKANASRVPPDYERRQTLANAERYTTPELKAWETKVLGAEDRIAQLETEIFKELCAQISAETKRIQACARALSALDALAALAEAAARRRYVRPIVHDGDEIEIVQGRHAIIEAASSEPFIPNDLYMNNSTDRLLIITGPNMGGKCLRGSTRIFTDHGLSTIADLKPTDACEGKFTEISCQVKARLGKSRATHFYTGGQQQTIKITTRFGYQIEGTPEHRIWVRQADGNEGWLRFGELSVGNMVAIDRHIDLWGQQVTIDNPLQPMKRAKQHRLPTELDEDLGYLFGLLIGDGTLTYRTGLLLTTKDDFIAVEFERIVNKHFGYRVRHISSTLGYRVSSRQIRVFLEGLGLGYGRAHEKYVPHSILRAPKPIAIAFLQGLFDTDGWAANQQVKVFFSTASERLAREVQLLLLNLGIVASLKIKKTKCRPSYQVAIYGADAIKFHQQVGFRLPRKRVRQEFASSLRMPNIGIPHLATTLKQVQADIVATNGKPIALKRNKSISSIFYTYLPQHRNISYNKLSELIDYCNQSLVSCSQLEAIQKQHYFYDSIVAIEPGMAEVFDLSIERDHSYIANGFVSHNSTNLRQAAIISILAQMGSFVPAERARLPLLDRIWTRVGASDDLARGRSTFMVEMTETAAILHNATPHSLILLDEIGRGTATFDGLSIAWAVAEYLHDSSEHAAKTLFATHYHELTELAERLPGGQNYQITAAEREGEVVFLHRLERGRASKSYGIEVARLAGLPPSAIARARDVLARLERYELDIFTEEEKQGEADSKPETEWEAWALDEAGLKSAARRARQKRIAMQATLFDAVNQNLLDELRSVDVETLKPEEALEILQDIRKRIV